MKANAKQFYEYFKAAANNQAAFDLFYYDLYKAHAENYSFLPRPAQWLNKGALLLRFLRVGAPFIWFLWCAFGGIYFFVRLLLLKAGSEKIKAHASLEKSVALAVCKRTVDVIVQADTGRDILFLKVPGVKNVDSCVGAVSAVSVLSFFELFKCFLLAVNIHYRLAYGGEKTEVFQSYAALDWVIVFFALIKLNPDQLIIAEHHDRWAVLADSYCGLKYHFGSRLELILVQHGLESPNTYERMVDLGFEMGLPYKLRNVTILYVYNDKQCNVFIDYIICGSVTKLQMAVRHYTYRLMLSDSGFSGNTILIIGYAKCEKFHLDLYRALSDIENLKCFYKPHPSLKPSHLLLSAGWILIEDKDYYPRVDLVVSYPSTLLVEYRSAGIDVIEHEFDAGDAEVGVLNSQIISAFVDK